MKVEHRAPAVEAPEVPEPVEAFPAGSVAASSVPETVPAPRGRNGWEALDHLAPARLVGELRSRTSLSAPREWSRKNVGAPVEERLEPRGASLTRRWQMLSRFDVVNDGSKVEQANEARDEVAAASEAATR